MLTPILSLLTPLQITGTAEWAGKDTSYEPNEQREYQMWVDWVKINPQTPENSTDPWPGQKYLKQMEGGKNDNHGADGTGTGSGSGSGSGSGAGSGSGSGNGGSGSKSGAGQLVAQLAGVFVLATTVFTTFLA